MSKNRYFKISKTHIIASFLSLACISFLSFTTTNSEESTCDKAKDKYEGAKDKVEEKAEDVKNEIKKDSKKVKRDIKKKTEEAREKANEVNEKIQHKTDEIKESTQEKVKEINEKISSDNSDKHSNNSNNDNANNHSTNQSNNTHNRTNNTDSSPKFSNDNVNSNHGYSVTKKILSDFLLHYSSNPSKIDQNIVKHLISLNCDVDHMYKIVYKKLPKDSVSKEKFLNFISLVFICYADIFKHLKINSSEKINKHRYVVKCSAPGNVNIQFIVRKDKIHDIFFTDDSFFKLIRQDAIKSIRMTHAKPTHANIETEVSRYSEALMYQIHSSK